MTKKSEEKDHLEGLGIDGRTILKYIQRNRKDWRELDLSGSGYGQAAGSCENDNEITDSKKCKEFLDSKNVTQVCA
jgi:hypothetical protein